MDHLLKKFFYAVALVSILWVFQTTPEFVTLVEWVRFLQSGSVIGITIALTVVLIVLDVVMSTPSKKKSENNGSNFSGYPQSASARIEIDETCNTQTIAQRKAVDDTRK